MSTEKEKNPQAKITDLPEPASSDREADKVKGGRMMANPTESGDVTPAPPVGGDQG